MKSFVFFSFSLSFDRNFSVSLRMCWTSCRAAFVLFCILDSIQFEINGLCEELKGCGNFSGHSPEG